MTIQTIGIGAAPGDDTGDGLRTGAAKINANFADVNNAASKLVGTATGEIPTADDLGMVGETNFTTGNYQPDVAGGAKGRLYMKNVSGAAINPNEAVPSASLQTTLWTSAGAISTTLTGQSGSYIYVGTFQLSDLTHGLFSKV